MVLHIKKLLTAIIATAIAFSCAGCNGVYRENSVKKLNLSTLSVEDTSSNLKKTTGEDYALSFDKDGGADGYAAIAAYASGVKSEYLTVRMRADKNLFIKMEADVINSLTAQKRTGTCEILVGEAYADYVFPFGEALNTAFDVVEKLKFYPSYGTRSGSGTLYLHSAAFSENMDSADPQFGYFDFISQDGSDSSGSSSQGGNSSDGSSSQGGNSSGGSSSQGGNSSAAEETQVDYLWQKYKNYFPIGAAVGANNLWNKYDDSEVIRHYNSMTCENEMKPYTIGRNGSGSYDYSKADNMLAFAKSKKMYMRGHTLVWHNGCPSWFCSGDKQQTLNNVTRYVTDVVNHFGSDVYCWDVVNEALSDNTSEVYRRSDFYNKTGTDYIFAAFEAARKANPNIKLYYNDYNLDLPNKRANAVALLKELKSRNLVDGVGMQGHYGVGLSGVYGTKNTNPQNVEASIKAFAALGLDVQITELDVENPNGARTEDQAELYGKLFEIFRRYKNVITGVTFWGVADDYSWLDNGSVKACALVFDGNYNKKSAFDAIFNF